MTEHPVDAISPVWPELVEVIAESPALILGERYYIAEIEAPEYAPEALMIFRDDTETTALVPSSTLHRARVKRQRGPYRAIRFVLGRPFSAPGFLASAALAIAKTRVNQLIYSTYSYDYILINEGEIQTAVAGLKRMGFAVTEEH